MGPEIQKLVSRFLLLVWPRESKAVHFVGLIILADVLWDLGLKHGVVQVLLGVNFDDLDELARGLDNVIAWWRIGFQELRIRVLEVYIYKRSVRQICFQEQKSDHFTLS